MARLAEETEIAVGRVLRLLCNGCTREDFDAVERHDEAALSLLDLNEENAIAALEPLRRCLGQWARRPTETEALWSIMTQPSAEILSKTAGDEPGEDSLAARDAVPMPAHRSLVVVLFRVSLLGAEVDGCPHRVAAPAAWVAGRVYFSLLTLQGAGAYGVLQPAMVGLVLSNIRSWCRNSSVYRSGGGGAVGSSGETNAPGTSKSKKNGSQKRPRRSRESVESSEGEDEEEGEREEGAGDEEMDAPVRERRAAVRRGGRTRAGAGSGSGAGTRWGVSGARGMSVEDQVLEHVRLIQACLPCVPIASYQDLVVKLSEVLVGVCVVGAAEGRAGLAEAASKAIITLGMTGLGRETGVQAAVLQALMPVILMSTGKADVPPRAKDCLKAHDAAVTVAKGIASALKNASHRRGDTVAGGNPQDQELSGATMSDNPVSQEGDASGVTPGGVEPAAADVSIDGIGQAAPGDQLQAPRLGPMLTMVQHLCVAAPERAEGRTRLAGGIASILPELPENDRARFVSFLAKLSRSARINHRGFAVELAARLLTESWAWLSADSDPPPKVTSKPADGKVSSSPGPHGDGTDASPCSVDGGGGRNGGGGSTGSGRVMLRLVVARAADRAPTVRSKAAATIAELVSEVRVERERATTPARSALRSAVMEAAGWGAKKSNVAQEGPLLTVVRYLVQDCKASVRRNAVPVLEGLLALSPMLQGEGGGGDGTVGTGDAKRLHTGDFGLLEGRCNDLSLSTRKAAMTALSTVLLSRPRDEHLQDAWVRALLPLAGDPEQSCQNRLVELVQSVILDRVVEWHRAEIAAIRKGGSRCSSKRRADTASVLRASTRLNVQADPPEPEARKPSEVEPQVGESLTNGGVCFSVWKLLAKAGHGEGHKCLRKAISMLISQKESGFRVGPVLNALRSAAVMALPPKAKRTDRKDASEQGTACDEERVEVGGEEHEEEEGWGVEEMRLLSLSETLPGSQITTIRQGAWALLEAFFDRASSSPGNAGGKSSAKKAPEMDPMFVVRCWKRIRGHMLEEGLPTEEADGHARAGVREDDFESDGRRVLGVLARLAWAVPPEVAAPLADRLLEMLLDLVVQPETTAALVDALHKLCFAKMETEEAGAAMCNAWANHALVTFEELLHVFVFQGSGALREHPGARACGYDMAQLVERLLFAIGEVSCVGFTAKEDAAGPSDPHVPGDNVGDPGLVRPKASPQLVELVQVLLPPRLPSSAHGVEEGEEGPLTPPAVRALAFVTLGKLCLRDKVLAKNSVWILVRELDTADDPAVRSNALVVLGDLCVRYTAMVDRYVGAMATCLQDPHPVVRRHAILLISQLLLQDYVKWRGLLLYRFLATLVDPDESVKELGFFTLTRPLFTKTPGLFGQNFVEALFVLNNYSEHPCYAAAAAGRADAGGVVTMDGIDLAGDSPGQVARRTKLYSTMLAHMSDELKITVTAKLAQEVLASVVDGSLPIAPGSAISSGRKSDAGLLNNKDKELLVKRKASSVVRDALTVMASPDIRVGGLGGRGGGDVDIEDTPDDGGSQQPGASGLAAAKTKLLCKVALKHLMETVVPILTALKHVLEKAHSPLLRELMQYFAELSKSHKEDVKAVLAAEPGLVNEIEFDIRRFEKAEQEQLAREAAMAAAATTAPQTMGPPRTPRGRRSLGAGGVGTGGIRDVASAARTSSRGVRTPVAAAIRSARKTPFQNLEECSAIKLKGTTVRSGAHASAGAAMMSPVLARGIGGGTVASRTPHQLRTPSQAVAAALGNNPQEMSPLPMRPMPGRDENHSSGTNGTLPRGKAAGGADIEVTSPDPRHRAKKARWSDENASSVGRSGSEGAEDAEEPSGEDRRGDDVDEDRTSRGGGLHAGKDARNPRKGSALHHHDPRVGDDARSERQKENDPPLENASRRMTSHGRKASTSEDGVPQKEGKGRSKDMAKSTFSGRGISSSSGSDQRSSARALKSGRSGAVSKVGPSKGGKSTSKPSRRSTRTSSGSER